MDDPCCWRRERTWTLAADAPGRTSPGGRGHKKGLRRVTELRFARARRRGFIPPAPPLPAHPHTTSSTHHRRRPHPINECHGATLCGVGSSQIFLIESGLEGPTLHSPESAHAFRNHISLFSTPAQAKSLPLHNLEAQRAPATTGRNFAAAGRRRCVRAESESGRSRVSGERHAT